MSAKQYHQDARNLVISRELPMKNSPQMSQMDADKEVRNLEAACLVFNLRSSAQSEDEEGGRPQMSLKQYNPDARNLVISRELPMKNSPQIKRLRIWKPPA